MRSCALYRDGRFLPISAALVNSIAGRALGLLARARDNRPDALCLTPCGAVHTAFMRQPIDIVFVASDGTVLRCVARVAPWRIAACRGAQSVWELRAGLAAHWDIRQGVRLTVAGVSAPHCGNARA